MTLQNLKDEILALAFETKDSYNEDPLIMINAINRSLNTIALEVYANEDITNIYINSSKITDLKTLPDFLNFKNLYKLEGSEYVKYDDYTLVDRTKLFVYDSGEYQIHYKKQPLQITQTTSDTQTLDFDMQTRLLLPLLSAFYLLRDDDPNKADIYYNDYEMKRKVILSTAFTSVAIIEKGVII